MCLQTAPMFERNYACDRWIYSYFRLIDLNETGAEALQRQLYFCMFGQALYMKAEVEGWRSNNIWGLLTWQYNEVWPTGGWGSIEYGTPVRRTNAAVDPCTLWLRCPDQATCESQVAGQSLGGRWKPLQHFLAASAFTDVTASCGTSQTFHTIGLVCYARNDLPTKQSVRVTVELLHFATGAVDTVSTTDMDLAAGAGTTVFFCADGRALAAKPAVDSAAEASACAPFAEVLNATGCSPQTCILNVTVAEAAFAPLPNPPFPPPPPPPPPPAPPAPPAPPKPPPPAPPPSKDCTFAANTDYQDGGIGGGVESTDQDACCALCKANPKCGAGVWLMNGEQPQCYLKSGAAKPYTRAGRYSCVPKNASQPVQLRATTGRVFARNLLPLTAPGRFELPDATVTASVSNDGTVRLTASATAAYVWLSTLAHGHFSENGIVLRPGTHEVKFVATGELDVAALKASLRVEHLQQHLGAPRRGTAGPQV